MNYTAGILQDALHVGIVMHLFAPELYHDIGKARIA